MLIFKFATKHLWNVGISLILSACSYIVMANCRFQAALPIVMIAKKSKLREFFAISTDSRNTWEGWSWAGGEDRWISVVSVAILYFHNLFRRWQGAKRDEMVLLLQCFFKIQMCFLLFWICYFVFPLFVLKWGEGRRQVKRFCCYCSCFSSPCKAAQLISSLPHLKHSICPLID